MLIRPQRPNQKRINTGDDLSPAVQWASANGLSYNGLSSPDIICQLTSAGRNVPLGRWCDGGSVNRFPSCYASKEAWRAAKQWPPNATTSRSIFPLHLMTSIQRHHVFRNSTKPLVLPTADCSLYTMYISTFVQHMCRTHWANLNTRKQHDWANIIPVEQILQQLFWPTFHPSPKYFLY